MQNIYDNNKFYNSYLKLRENNAGLNEVLEIPAFRSLLPDLDNKTILDLGCGYGENCKWYINKGAKKVIGIDISKNMIEKAKKEYSDDKIEYKNVPMEELDFSKNIFDIVLSSLSFHYVKDFNSLIEKINKMLKPNGSLVFSQEHPIATAKKKKNGWFINNQGEKSHWIMDNYHYEGKREQEWFIDGVIKYHRTIATILNTLIKHGFNILKVLEPIALETAEKNNAQLKEERRRPPFIIIKVKSTKCIN
ncbi:methyltransferase domain-containing protein [Iocasia frigidifontis]|uniref:Methyltransferase domain-containing protein n=1 Tax=Iocasia fonsfrigidae TaxID=2682810 RepID=A0A8A7K742_9FIRM|nr:class I SAM-dependent methyltransferase [Iocasia fonsfrigidae]QTL97536.1 methyltransferase domain-containing protein [Iocasia fonsfrigidae]